MRLCCTWLRQGLLYLCTEAKDSVTVALHAMNHSVSRYAPVLEWSGVCPLHKRCKILGRTGSTLRATHTLKKHLWMHMNIVIGWCFLHALQTLRELECNGGHCCSFVNVCQQVQAFINRHVRIGHCISFIDFKYLILFYLENFSCAHTAAIWLVGTPPC